MLTLSLLILIKNQELLLLIHKELNLALLSEKVVAVHVPTTAPRVVRWAARWRARSPERIATAAPVDVQWGDVGLAQPGADRLDRLTVEWAGEPI